MSILYPKFRFALLPSMLGYAAAGAALAGFYGVVHDQVTYSISQEYFTRLKFLQFHYADFGLPPRVLVGEIGFLATWWVGFIAGWLIARVSVPAFSGTGAIRHCAYGFLIGTRMYPSSFHYRLRPGASPRVRLFSVGEPGSHVGGFGFAKLGTRRLHPQCKLPWWPDWCDHCDHLPSQTQARRTIPLMDAPRGILAPGASHLAR